MAGIAKGRVLKRLAKESGGRGHTAKRSSDRSEHLERQINSGQATIYDPRSRKRESESPIPDSGQIRKASESQNFANHLNYDTTPRDQFLRLDDRENSHTYYQGNPEVSAKTLQRFNTTYLEEYAKHVSNNSNLDPVMSFGGQKSDTSTTQPVNATEALSTLQCLSMFQCEDLDGQIINAVAVTASVLRQLNVIAHCEAKISNRINNIEDFEYQTTRVTNIIRRLESDLKSPKVEIEVQRIIVGKIAAAHDVREQVVEELERLKEKVHENQQELKVAQAAFLDDWKRLLEKHELYRVPSDISLGSIGADEYDFDTSKEEKVSQKDNNSTSTAQYQEESFSHNGVTRTYRFRQPNNRVGPTDPTALVRETAREYVRTKNMDLGAAQRRIDQWPYYYQNKLKSYNEDREGGVADTSRTEFDGLMLMEEREATRNLIESEENLKSAKHYARQMGVFFTDPDQESDFLDHPHDGYRESHEEDRVGNVNREWIEKWLKTGENQKNTLTECDEWDFRTVDFGDSVSVKAAGNERIRIERWKTTCELLATEREEMGVITEDRK